MSEWVRQLDTLDNGDVALVGGKNASLGEMLQRLGEAGVRVPAGFATTADAYREFLAANDLERSIAERLGEAAATDRRARAEAGADLRRRIREAELPDGIAEAIRRAYAELGEGTGEADPPVAVRSSATAEDLPEASFAGQQETFLNVRGENALLEACKRCYASLFTDRAVAYREEHGFDHLQVALSVGVQRMVRADTGAAGVMFTLDTESGFRDVVLINAAWGLGETVVQGAVDPDEFLVFKPLMDREGCLPIIERRPGSKARRMVYGDSPDEPTRTEDTPRELRRALTLDDEEVMTLARWAVTIERHYGRPMDIEWAKDGESGELHILQARPETVQSRREPGALKSYRVGRTGRTLTTGLAIGQAVAAGKVCRLGSAEEIADFEEGAVLVTGMTDPDWVPIMKRAAAIVTDHGGRTSHAAIVSRELGLPAVVGTGDATEVLEPGAEVTVSCAEGEQGRVYEGEAEFEAEDVPLDDIPETRTRVMLNLADPAGALRWWRLPADGVGLARMEFIINGRIKIHPMALVHPERVEDAGDRRRIEELTAGWEDRPRYFVDQLAHGIARIAAARHPDPVIVRLSDFKTNEYAELLGGAAFEPAEANPMIGWRGASRYYDEGYREGFALECEAIRRVRGEMGLDNVVVMVPFCRTPEEADKVLAVMAGHGLGRGEDGLQVYVMCEVPSNVVLADRFAERFDGFSIGSNDLTQLALGVDRDSDRLAALFDERSEAVTRMIEAVIETAHRHGRKVGLCGQAPSDHPDFAELLVRAGIDSISVNPDSFLAVKRRVAEAEQGQQG